MELFKNKQQPSEMQQIMQNIAKTVEAGQRTNLPVGSLPIAISNSRGNI